MKDNRRLSGVLLHPTSLPSPFGIGDLGESAYEFVDFLVEAGQHLWQILPLTPTGYGDSPYQSFSAFAGQPLLISPSHLLKLGLIEETDLSLCTAKDEEHIHYGEIIPLKWALLETAYENFLKIKENAGQLRQNFDRFVEDQAFWLQDYALFMACKKANGGKSWLMWEERLRRPKEGYKNQLRESLSQEIGFYQFLQFLFFEEWNKLKAYANERDIQIIGDIPIFVSMDSADVWANPHLFQLDERGYPRKVAGVPPDYFSATGQLWGNPLYDWDAHKKEGFSWWISRIRHQLHTLDILRIDHFRGFESYWSVPYGEKTAVNGTWVSAPGYELFQSIQQAFGGCLPIIAEDLGVITPEVNALREAFRFPGMKVLQFAFDGLGENAYLPHQFQNQDCVCYTGTHDNDTTLGWYQTLPADCREKVRQYACCTDDSHINWGLIRVCLSSIARYAVVPLQDVLGYGSRARMNTPSTASGNWDWRYKKGELTKEHAQKLKDITVLYGRY